MNEDEWGSGCIDPRCLDIGTSWRRVVNVTSQSLYLRYSVYRRLFGPRAGFDDMKKRELLDLSGLEHHLSVVQPEASRHTDYATAASEIKIRAIRSKEWRPIAC